MINHCVVFLAEFCKQKWETLLKGRRQHNDRKRKRDKSGSGATSRAKEFYEFEKEMSFCPLAKGQDGPGLGNVEVDNLDSSFISEMSASSVAGTATTLDSGESDAEIENSSAEVGCGSGVLLPTVVQS